MNGSLFLLAPHDQTIWNPNPRIVALKAKTKFVNRSQSQTNPNQE